MTDAGDVSQRGSAGERPVGDLVRQLSEQLSVLVRDEIRLAQLELTRKGKKAGIGAGLLGGSGLVVVGLAGKSSLRTATPPVPDEAAESIRTDVKVIKERAGR